MRSYLRHLQGGSSVKRWLGLGFGIGLGFELARDLLPIVAFILFLGLLAKPRLTLAIIGGIVALFVIWQTRHLWRTSAEERAKREARKRWSGGVR